MSTPVRHTGRAVASITSSVAVSVRTEQDSSLTLVETRESVSPSWSLQVRSYMSSSSFQSCTRQCKKHQNQLRAWVACLASGARLVGAAHQLVRRQPERHSLRNRHLARSFEQYVTKPPHLGSHHRPVLSPYLWSSEGQEEAEPAGALVNSRPSPLAALGEEMRLARASFLPVPY